MVAISERVRRLAAEGGWIGVDFDGTMFTYNGWVAWNVFGDPIQPMIDRVLHWYAESIPVKIFTARIGAPLRFYDVRGKLVVMHDTAKRQRCHHTGESFSNADMVHAIQAHAKKHGLPLMDVTCVKDHKTIEFWDDIAIQVVANTGMSLAEAHQAELEAERGKVYARDDNG